MNAEFNWWLLIVGLVVGAGLVWLVLADWSRREEDVAADELSVESAWIAQALRDRGEDVDPTTAEEILALHRAYLRDTGALETPDEGAEGSEATDDDAAWPPDTTEGDTAGDATGAVHWRDAPEIHAPEATIDHAPEGRWPDASMGNANPHAGAAGALEAPREHHSVREMPLTPRGGPPPDPDVEANGPRR